MQILTDHILPDCSVVHKIRAKIKKQDITHGHTSYQLATFLNEQISFPRSIICILKI